MKSFLLKILSLIYGLVIYIRNSMFNMKMLSSREFNLPIISIGNITVGGTGKTPHTEYLVNLLFKDFKVATLSRGYKRKTRGFLIVEKDAMVNNVGDEPLQIKQKFNSAIVVVDEKRVRGIEKLLALPKEERPDVILLDDAYQHRYVNPGVNILLTDYSRLITQDSLLPHGRLREPASNRDRANIIIVTKCPPQLKPIDERIITKELDIRPYQNLYFTTFEYGPLIPVFSETPEVALIHSFAEYTILVVTGIANPAPLKEHIQHHTHAIYEMAFPDHHDFSKKEVENISNQFSAITSTKKIIVTTEKDMIRLRCMVDLPEVVKNNLYYIPLKVSFLNNGEKDFDQKIRKYVRENKSNFDLYSKSNRL